MRSHNRAFSRHCLQTLLPLLAVLGSGVAVSQTALLDEVHTIATAATGVPIEHDFDVSNAGTYAIQLQDLGALGTPSAPVASVQLVLTQGDSIVGAPLVAAGSLQFTAAAAGHYRLHVIGTPGTTPGSGSVGIQLTDSSSNVLSAWSDNLVLPARATPDSLGLLNDRFVVSSAGTYQIALTDLHLPSSLATVSLLLTAEDQGSPPVVLPDPLTHATQQSVALAPGSYRIIAFGQTDSNTTGGLFSASVTAAGTSLYSKVVPLGGVISLGTTTLTAGAATLAAADLASPAALAQLAVVSTLNGQFVAQVAGTGNAAFTALSGVTYETFAFATPGPTPGAGSYAAQLSVSGASTALSVARGVATPASSLQPFSFDTSLTAAGTYSVNLTDFQFPKALVSASLAAVQNLSIQGTPLTAPGSSSLNGVAGPLSLVGFAQAGTAGSLLDVNVAAGQTLIFDATQAVGVAFTPLKLSITAAGTYQLTATDLGFLAPFSDFGVVITQGGTNVGSIVGGGTSRFVAPLGNYFVNFVAHPSATANVGTYALNVAPVPPAPIVTLTADVASVSSGGTVRLAWTVQNATSCSGSGGGWSGTYTADQAIKGQAQSAAITAATTFTLTCTGAGGSGANSINIVVAAPETSGGGGGGGGGGSLDPTALLVLAGALAASVSVRRGGCRTH